MFCLLNIFLKYMTCTYVQDSCIHGHLSTYLILEPSAVTDSTVSFKQIPPTPTGSTAGDIAGKTKVSKDKKHSAAGRKPSKYSSSFGHLSSNFSNSYKFLQILVVACCNQIFFIYSLLFAFCTCLFIKSTGLLIVLISSAYCHFCLQSFIENGVVVVGLEDSLIHSDWLLANSPCYMYPV